LQQGDAMYAEKNLLKAGFKAYAVQTPKEQASFAKIPPYTLQAHTKNGATYYRYADPRQQKVYVGGQQEYNSYQNIVNRKAMQDVTRQEQETNWAGARMMMF